MSLTVKGAHYKPTERPPEGVKQHQGGMGWVAPPGGVDDDLTQRALDAALKEVINSQFELESEISKYAYLIFFFIFFCHKKIDL